MNKLCIAINCVNSDNELIIDPNGELNISAMKTKVRFSVITSLRLAAV